MDNSTSVTRWLLAATSLLVVGLLASSCGSGDSNGGASNCSLGGYACKYGCSRDYGCYDCETNADCVPGSPICVTGRCVACGTNADCATAEVCAPANHQCTEKCQSDATCRGNSPKCDTALGVCVGCTTDADCATTNGRTKCDATRRQCSQCVSRSDCGAAAPACNLQNGNCEQCLIDADCGSGYACNQNHTCTALCKSNTDCNNVPGRPLCNPASGLCVECLDKTSCTSPNASVCSPENRCVSCASNGDCPSTAPLCDTAARNGARCVVCTATEPCTDTVRVICDDQGQCVQCRNNRDCTNTEQPTCNQGLCVAG